MHSWWTRNRSYSRCRHGSINLALHLGISDGPLERVPPRATVDRFPTDGFRLVVDGLTEQTDDARLLRVQTGVGYRRRKGREELQRCDLDGLSQG